MSSTHPMLIALMGPTSSGKTCLAEQLAARLDAILVNADAFQIYRGMDIGTAKPAQRQAYRLLDIRTPDESFGVGEWTQLASEVLREAFSNRRSAIVVGGTGLYIRALFEEYSSMASVPDQGLRTSLNETPIEELRERLIRENPDIANRTDMANPVRVRRALERMVGKPSPPIRLPPFIKLKLGLNPELSDLGPRIERRVQEMLHNGWVQEIERLRQEGYVREAPGFRAIGYRTLWDLLDGKVGLDEAKTTINVETRRYAKRQRTWLRTEPNLYELASTNESDTFRSSMERVESFL